jgi:hypothetical protein
MAKPSRPGPTAEEKRAAARRRVSDESRLAEYGQPVGATLFSSGRTSSRSVGRSRTHTLGPIRITAELAEQIADYGNALGLNQSDTVRRLLRDALEQKPSRKRRGGRK